MNCFPKACLSLPRRKQTQPNVGSGGSKLAEAGQRGAGLERKERGARGWWSSGCGQDSPGRSGKEGGRAAEGKEEKGGGRDRAFWKHISQNPRT